MTPGEHQAGDCEDKQANRPFDGRLNPTDLGEREKLSKKLDLSPRYGTCEDFNSTKNNNSSAMQKKSSIGDHQKGGNLSASFVEKTTILERAAKRIPGLGIILALFASLFLGTAGMLVKMTHSVHGIQVAVFRAMIQLLIYSFIISLRRLHVLPERREFLPVLGRALLGATSITLSYYALKLIPLGDATTIRFSLPIWTLIISYFILGESCNLLKVAAVIISISGVVLIAKPDDCLYLANLVGRQLGLESQQEFQQHWRAHEDAKLHRLQQLPSGRDDDELGLPPPESIYSKLNGSAADVDAVEIVPLNGTRQQFHEQQQQQQLELEQQQHQQPQVRQQLEGCLMALGSSICLSLSLISMRLCKQTPTEIIILWLSICSIALGTGTLVALDEWRLPDNLLDCVYILANGLCGSIGQWFITSALKIEQSGVIALARTFDIEVAFLYSALLLHEQIRATSIVGSILVSSGVVIVVIPRWLGSRNSSNNENTEQPIEPTDNEHQRDKFPDQLEATSQHQTMTIMGQDSAIGSTDGSSSSSSEDEQRRRVRLEEDFFNSKGSGPNETRTTQQKPS